jgi:hypothetical protein
VLLLERLWLLLWLVVTAVEEEEEAEGLGKRREKYWLLAEAPGAVLGGKNMANCNQTPIIIIATHVHARALKQLFSPTPLLMDRLSLGFFRSHLTRTTMPS